MSNITLLPKWRKNKSAAELFEELATYARTHPEKFERVVVLYFEDNDDKCVPRYIAHNASTVQMAGMLALAVHNLYERTTT